MLLMALNLIIVVLFLLLNPICNPPLQTAKKSRREAEMERKEAELKLSKLEAELMEPSARPESAEAFERLLLSSPDSSLLWLQYMAFQLQATQIEQARAVAERALKTISFRWGPENMVSCRIIGTPGLIFDSH